MEVRFDYDGMEYVYLLRSVVRSGELYIGVTADLSQRLDRHNAGRCLYTAKFRPWEIVYVERVANRNEALRRERQIKKWTRAKKVALITGDAGRLKELSKRKG